MLVLQARSRHHVRRGNEARASETSPGTPIASRLARKSARSRRRCRLQRGLHRLDTSSRPASAGEVLNSQDDLVEVHVFSATPPSPPDKVLWLALRGLLNGKGIEFPPLNVHYGDEKESKKGWPMLISGSRRAAGAEALPAPGRNSRHFFTSLLSSIRLGEHHPPLRRLARHHALARLRLAVERNAANRRLRLLGDAVFRLARAVPVRQEEAARLLDLLLELVVGVDLVQCWRRGTSSPGRTGRVCIALSISPMRAAAPASGTPISFASLPGRSRRASTHASFARSFGPSSTRTGTPFSSHSLNL